MFYALAAKGKKPGGFNGVYFGQDIDPAFSQLSLANGDAVIDQEQAITYEAGTKSQFFDGRVSLNPVSLLHRLAKSTDIRISITPGI